MIKCLNNKIILIILSGLFLSISLNFYFIKKFNIFDHRVSDNHEHHMLKSDPEKFWRQAHNIQIDIQQKKDFFDTGYEYRVPYLPSKILYIFSVIFDEKFYDYDEKIIVDSLLGIDDKKEKKIKINSDNKKLIFLILQSLIYYSSILFLYTKANKIFDKQYILYLIIFLSFEPNLLMFHSSFWSESIFFSLLIFSLALILDENLTYKNSIFLGILLGILFLQRSVAIYYIFIVLSYYLLIFDKRIIKKIPVILFSYLLVLFFLGYHNFNRSSVFQIKPTQAMDGFYVYMVPNILAEKKSESLNSIYENLEEEKNTWIIDNKINLNKEADKINYYKYLEKKSFEIINSNLFLSLKYIIDKTKNYLVFDPFRHVYYFYKYSLIEQDEFTKTRDHKKNILFRILYSSILYLFVIMGLLQIYKEKNSLKLFLFLFLFLSILYFTAVSSWTGNNRYNVPNLIFMSFFIPKGILFFKKFFLSNKL